MGRRLTDHFRSSVTPEDGAITNVPRLRRRFSPRIDYPRAALVPIQVGTATDTVAVVGMGYVGLPTALAFATSGLDVTGLEINRQRIDAIRAGLVDLVPSDRERLRTISEKGTLGLSPDPSRLRHAAAVIICVPTPVDPHQVPDLAALRGACATAVENAVAGQTIILTSTSYVGTTRDLLVDALEQRDFVIGTDVFVAFSAERIDPGSQSHANAIVPRVVGGVTERCTERASRFIGRIAPVHAVSSPEAAEMTKLLENTFRAVNISLVNEFATASNHLNVDIAEVIEAAATKPYGFMAFQPGPGVGGHCIPCDPHYLLWQLRSRRIPMPLVSQAMTSLAERPGHVVTRAAETLSAAGLGISGARILVVGVAYKPGVEDVRESTAIEIIMGLRNRRAAVSYTDAYVGCLQLPGGDTLTSIPVPRGSDYDLVLVHTLHPGVDYSWVRQAPMVLDATYRLTSDQRTTVV